MNIGVAYIDVMRPMLVILSLIAPISIMLFYHGEVNFFVLLAVLFGNAGLNVLNEILDAETDKILKPWRPIPSGKISIKKALVLSILFTSMAIVCLLPLEHTRALIGIFGIFCGAMYNIVRYYSYGENIFLGLAYGLTSYFCSYPYGLDFSIAFGLMTVAFNIAVQIQDVDADKKAGQKTLPILLGIDKSRVLGIVIGLVSTLVFVFVEMSVKFIFILSNILVILALLINDYNGYKYIVRYSTRSVLLYAFILMVIRCLQ